MCCYYNGWKQSKSICFIWRITMSMPFPATQTLCDGFLQENICEKARILISLMKQSTWTTMTKKCDSPLEDIVATATQSKKNCFESAIFSGENQQILFKSFSKITFSLEKTLSTLFYSQTLRDIFESKIMFFLCFIFFMFSLKICPGKERGFLSVCLFYFLSSLSNLA